MDIQSTIPRSVESIPEVLRALEQLGGTATSMKIDELVIKNLGLSKDLVEQRHSEGKAGRTEIKYRLAWSRTLAKRAGAISLVGTRTWTLNRS